MESDGHVLHGAEHWRNLAITIELSMCAVAMYLCIVCNLYLVSNLWLQQINKLYLLTDLVFCQI